MSSAASLSQAIVRSTIISARSRPQRGSLCTKCSGGSPQTADDEPPAVVGDWREFRAKLVLSKGNEAYGRASEDNKHVLEVQNPRLAAEGAWAHTLPGPEKGGLLIATPTTHEMLHNDRMWQVVIFLLQHNSEGTYGLVLNRPTGLVFGRREGRASNGLPLPLEVQHMGEPQLQEVFKDNRLYCGGEAAQQYIHMMHGYKHLHKAVEVVPGIYLGGQRAALKEVQAGTLMSEGFKFFSGAVLWKPDQLNEELQQGCWYTAACSRSLVLKQCLQLPIPFWKEVLDLMGGQYREVARATYAAEE